MNVAAQGNRRRPEKFQKEKWEISRGFLQDKSSFLHNVSWASKDMKIALSHLRNLCSVLLLLFICSFGETVCCYVDILLMHFIVMFCHTKLITL